KKGAQAQLIENRTKAAVKIGDYAEGEAIGELLEYCGDLGITLPNAWDCELSVKLVEIGGPIERVFRRYATPVEDLVHQRPPPIAIIVGTRHAGHWRRRQGTPDRPEGLLQSAWIELEPAACGDFGVVVRGAFWEVNQGAGGVENNGADLCFCEHVACV